MDIVISDFDNTLFKRNYGIIEGTVAKVVALGYPVVIVSYRATNQQHFILDTLAPTGIMVEGLVLLDDRSKTASKKLEAAMFLQSRYNIVVAVDDEKAVRQLYESIGIRCVAQ